MALAGMDPIAFLRTRDSLERAVMQAIARRVVELDRDRDQSRANMIANAVGKLFK